MAQIRGGGTLILYESVLFFKLWIINRTILIPIKNITDIEITPSHLMKTRFRPHLKVIFINENGKLDSVAWFIRKFNLWFSTVERLIQ